MHIKYWWDNSLKTLKHESMLHYNKWVENGRPREGRLWESKIHARKEYKKAIISMQRAF